MGSCGEKVTLRRCVRIKKWAITRHPICIHLHLELPRPSMVRNNFLLYTGYPHFLVAVIVAKRDYALFLRCPLFLLPLSPASSLSILYKRAAWTWARTLAPFTDLSISGYGLTSQLRSDTHKASYKAQRGSDVNVFKENLSLTFSCGRIKKKKKSYKRQFTFTCYEKARQQKYKIQGYLFAVSKDFQNKWKDIHRRLYW